LKIYQELLKVSEHSLERMSYLSFDEHVIVRSKSDNIEISKSSGTHCELNTPGGSGDCFMTTSLPF